MSWQNEMKQQGFITEQLPIEWLGKLQQDAGYFYTETEDVVSKEAMDYYNFDLPVEFTARSVILSVMPGRFTPVTFQKAGKELKVMLPPTYSSTYSGMLLGEQILTQTLGPDGYRVQLTPCIPQKPLAVASGLAQYGRNNVTYIEGVGSLYGIATYYSDLPCQPKEMKPLVRMDRCENCKSCQRHCPTQAVPENGILKASRCITYYNEITDDAFPGWMPKEAHQYLLGCMGCQGSCPANASYLKNIGQGIVFDAAETALIFAGAGPGELQEKTLEKLDSVGLRNYCARMERNVMAVMANFG